MTIDFVTSLHPVYTVHRVGAVVDAVIVFVLIDEYVYC